MCRWIAYLGQTTYIHDFLYDGTRSLCAQAQHSHKAKLGVHGDGGGLGWYGDHKCPGLYRNAGPAWADPNLRELTAQLKAKLFFGHVRASTGAPNTFVNCHPFRMDHWLFMHNGQIGGFSKLQRQIERLISDEAYKAINGTTDSELMFGLLVTYGLYECAPTAIRKTIETINDLSVKSNIEEPFRATFAVSNGDEIWAVRWSSDEYAPSLYQRNLDGDVLLASEPLDGEVQNWCEITPNSLINLKRGDDQITKIQIQTLFVEEVQNVRTV
ncbi:class II glutamine amidotransferase [Maritalea sp.]|uniref:class II glutamine amidotransferase n=1 Tax=Maritalea sp. TaxID=2003361 RepID=UPI003EF66C93